MKEASIFTSVDKTHLYFNPNDKDSGIYDIKIVIIDYNNIPMKSTY